MPTEIIRSWTNIRLENLPSIAKEIWTLLPQPHFVALDAEMGSGKTTLAIHIIAEAQKKGGMCAIIDAEHAFDSIYAKKT